MKASKLSILITSLCFIFTQVQATPLTAQEKTKVTAELKQGGSIFILWGWALFGKRDRMSLGNRPVCKVSIGEVSIF